MVVAQWLQSRVRQRGGRSAVVAAQSDTARWLERGIINVQILRHNVSLSSMGAQGFADERSNDFEDLARSTFLSFEPVHTASDTKHDGRP